MFHGELFDAKESGKLAAIVRYRPLDIG